MRNDRSLAGPDVDHVLGFQVGLVVLAVLAVAVVLIADVVVRHLGAIDVLAIDIADHESQAGNAIGGEVQVVAGLPGFLAGAVEVGVLHGVGEENRVTAAAGTVLAEADIIKRLIAMDLLVGQGESVRIQSVGCRQGPSGVADVAGLGLAFIVCAVDVEIEAQRLVGCQWDGVVAVQVILTIDVFEFSTVQGGAEVIGDCVAAPMKSALLAVSPA